MKKLIAESRSSRRKRKAENSTQPHISCFKNAYDTKPVGRPIPLDKLFDQIATRPLPLQDKIRGEESEAKRSRLKERLPGVTLSGTFSPTRANKNLIQHSGVLQADIDDVTEKEIPAVKQILCDSSYMIAVWRSVSGKLKAAIRISDDAAQHKASFLAAKVYIKDLTGKEIDEKCKDVSRLCFLSHDPDIWRRPFQDAQVLPPLPTRAKEEKKQAPAGALKSSDLDLDDARNIAEKLKLTIIRDFEPHDEEQRSWKAFVTCPAKDHTKDDHCALFFNADGSMVLNCQSVNCTEVIKQSNAKLAQAVKVRRLTKAWVYIVATKRFLHTETFIELDKEQFSDQYAPIAPKETKASGWLLRKPVLRRFDSPIYEPGKPQIIETPDHRLRYFNLWRPPLNIVVPRTGSVKPLLNHFEYLWPDECVHLIEFLAWNFQHPGEKLLYAILLRTVQGGGKSIIRSISGDILGRTNIRMITNEVLHEKYTTWGKNICLLFPDELMGHFRIKLTEHFKVWITEPLFEVRDMYGTSYIQPNKFNIIAFTNHKDALILDTADRRWCVLFSDQPAKDIDTYHAPLWDWRRENIAPIYNYFLNYDLSKFNRYKKAPETSGKIELIRRTTSALETFLRDALEDRRWPLQGEVISNTALLVALQNHPRLAALQLGRLNKRTLHDALQNIGSEYFGHFEIPGEGWRHLQTLQRHDYWDEASVKMIVEAYRTWLTSLGDPKSYEDERPI